MRNLFRQVTELMVTIDHESQTLHLPPLPCFYSPFAWAYRFLWGSD